MFFLNFSIKILDIIIGSIYGIILFSILFYFSYIAFFKNFIDDKNRIMKFNISIYENLMYKVQKVEKKNKKESSIKEKNDFRLISMKNLFFTRNTYFFN